MKSVTILPLTGLPDPLLSYAWPDGWPDPLPGMRVRIPLGKREVAGFVWESPQTQPQRNFVLKSPLELLERDPLLPSFLMPVYQFSAWFYRLPLGLLVRNTLPVQLTRPVRFPDKYLLPILSSRDTDIREVDLFPLTEDQKTVFDTWKSGLSQGFHVTVLKGVTGSGKTRVYQEMVRNTLAKNQQVLILTPEIGLVPQLESSFSPLVKDIAVVHSKIPPGKRLSTWLSVRRGEVTLVIGPRSAFFSPLERLGLIIVDEEHDSAYQAWEGLSFNVRNLALKLAQERGIPVVLGSATPLAESIHFTRNSRYSLLSLPRRIHGLSLPPIHLTPPSPKDTFLPAPLIHEIEENINRDEQTVILLNRRGYAPVLRCLSCGGCATCQKCSVRMVLHKNPYRQLVCHLCGYRAEPRNLCPDCGGTFLSEEGLATQKVEDRLKILFPEARIERLDQDSRDSRRKSIADFNDGEGNILVGTQMIAKGHDFRNVSLGIALETDQAMALPDYRNEERVFQLVLQLAGRVGRHKEGGRVHIVTRSPDIPFYQFLKRYDQEGFIDHVLRERQVWGYPPFGRIALLTVSSRSEKTLLDVLPVLEPIKSSGANSSCSIMGPVPAPVYKANLYFRYQYLIKSPSVEHIHSILDAFQKEMKPLRGVRAEWSVDPPDLLSF